MAAPSNQTAGTAIDLGSLPASVTQDVHDGGITYDVWYTVTAPVGSTALGVFGFGALADPYKPRTRVYSDAGVTQIVDTGTSNENRRVQFPVTPGNTYWLRFTPNAGDPTPAELQLSAEVGPNQSAPVGSICVNDDTEGFPLVIVSAVDGDDNNVLRFVNSGFPAGEAADVLTNGRSLVADAWNGNCKLFDVNYTLLATIGRDVGFDIPLRACHGRNSFYLTERTTGPTTVTLYEIDEDGVEISSEVLTGETSQPRGIAAKNDGTILYYARNGTAEQIRRYDLIGSAPLSDLALGIAGYQVSDILYLDDDTILALFFNFSTGDVLVRQYNTSGTQLNEYMLGISGFPLFTFPRMAYALDNPDSFWVWTHFGTSTSVGSSKFRNILISDGSTLAEIDYVEYESGVYQEAETATPIANYGISFSCPFWLTRTASAPIVKTPGGGIYSLNPSPITAVSGPIPGPGGGNQGANFGKTTDDFFQSDGSVIERKIPNPFIILGGVHD